MLRITVPGSTIHNMCFVKEGLASAGSAPVGVFAWCRHDGLPRSCAVTPYVIDGSIVVTTTLALPTKAFAVQRDQRVALHAGGWLVQARGIVRADPTPRWFDQFLRAQELAKYPPARSLLAVPGHRRLFSWYVGRVVIRLADPEMTRSEDVATDRATVTGVRDGRLRIDPLVVLEQFSEERAAEVTIPRNVDGPVDVLVHEEHRDFSQLCQLHVRGVAESGCVGEAKVSGSLTPRSGSAIRQLRDLRDLGRLARRHASRVAALPSVWEAAL